MEIRKLDKKDYKKFIELTNEFRPIGLDITQEKFNEIYDIIFSNSIIFVLILNNKIVGSAKLIIEQKFIHKLAKYGHIEDVIISNDYRGQGLGKLLIKNIVNYCKNNQFYKIILTCKDSLISFYQNS